MAILESEAALEKALFNAIPALVFLKDRENRFVKVNNAFCKAMSVTKEQVEGKSASDLYPKEQAEAFWEDDKEVLMHGEPKRNIIEQINSPEGALWFRTDKIPFKNEEGEIVGVIGFSIDVTEQKKIEDALKGKVLETERLNQLMVGRELKMLELKQRIQELETNKTGVISQST